MKTCRGYSLEVPHWGTSNEYPQQMFLCRNKKDINTFGLKKASYHKLCSYQRLCSLFRVFIVRMKKLCINSYPKCIHWRFWSECMNVQADPNLCWSHISEGMFFLHLCIIQNYFYRMVEKMERWGIWFFHSVIWMYLHPSPASVAQLDAPSDWRPGGRGFNPRRGRQHSFVEIDHEIFSTVILSLPLIREGQMSVSGERMCTILVNRLED